MQLDHETCSEHLAAAADEFRAPLALTHPLLDQLLQLLMQALLAYLPPTTLPVPTPTPKVEA